MTLIRNDAELARVAKRTSEGLQAIQNYLGDKSSLAGKVKFPRGYFSSAGQLRQEFSWIENWALKTNIAYTAMMLEVLRWLVRRTDIYAVPKEMIIKSGLFLLASICEAMMFQKGTPGLGLSATYKKRTKRLVELEVIEDDLKTELDWIWDTRSKVHLHLLENREFQKYVINDFEKAVRAEEKLRKLLINHFAD